MKNSQKKIDTDQDLATATSDLQDLESEAVINLQGWKKALADYQNLQKETSQKLSAAKEFVLVDLLRDILPIFDNFERGLQHLPEAEKNEPWAVGLEHVWRQWQSWLENHSVQKIACIGQAFDPHRHEAVGVVQDLDKDDHEIVAEQMSGYVLQDKLIRPAQVIINQLDN